MYAVEKLWIVSISTSLENISNLLIEDHYLTKNHQMFCLSKVTPTESYLNLILANNTQRTLTNLKRLL